MEKETETKITYEWNSLADKKKSAEKRTVIIKKEYQQLIENADIELEIFKQANPVIYAKFIFSATDNQFSIYNLVDFDQIERNICQNFLNLLNEMADSYLKDIENEEV